MLDESVCNFRPSYHEGILIPWNLDLFSIELVLQDIFLVNGLHNRHKIFQLHFNVWGSEIFRPLLSENFFLDRFPNTREEEEIRQDEQRYYDTR